MSSGIVRIIAVICYIALIIYFVKHNKEIIDYIKNNTYSKDLKIVGTFLIVIGIISYSLFVIGDLFRLQDNIEFAIQSNKNYKIFDEYDKKIAEETRYYEDLMKNEYEDGYSEPYIPEGFTKAEGEWDTGFVIEDESGNQYVWIPVTNKETDKAQKLIKKDFTIDPLIGQIYCFDDNYEEFMKSALENGGFYVSRYEVGLDGEKVVSKADKAILTGLTKEEVISKLENAYNGKNFNYELINGYAYDTLIEWLRKDTNPEVYDVDIDSEILTGRNKVKNVYDVFDNVLEYTIENNYDTVTVRGFTKEGEVEEGNLKENSRYAITPEANAFNGNAILSARTIIYK